MALDKVGSLDDTFCSHIVDGASRTVAQKIANGALRVHGTFRSDGSHSPVDPYFSLV